MMTTKSPGWHLCLVLIVFSVYFTCPAYCKIRGEELQRCQNQLGGILMNKQFISKVTFPATTFGIDINILGFWNHGKISDRLSDYGIGIEIGEPANVTQVRLKDQHIEIHLNGGGPDDIFDGAAKQTSAKKSGGSRINLRFDRDITPEDIDVEALANWLEPLVDTYSLQQDIAWENIPDEFMQAAENGEIVAGMDKYTVFAIMGDPFERKLDADVDPPVEIWEYRIERMQIMLVTFEGGKVVKAQIF